MDTGGGGDGGAMHILACMAASPIWVGLGKPGNFGQNPGERQINEGNPTLSVCFGDEHQLVQVLSSDLNHLFRF